MPLESMRRLMPGQFFGEVEARHETGGFSLSLLKPVVSEARVERHTHEGAHFVFVLDGSYLTGAANAPDVCRGPILIFNPPGTTHRDRFVGDHGRFLAIAIDDATLRDVGGPTQLPPFATAYDDPGRLLLAGQLARECERWHDGAQLSAAALSLELTASLLGTQPRHSTSAPRWLRNASEMLRDGCASEIGLDEVASAAGVHPVHLARVFRRHFGCTPGVYLRRCRIERASALLRDTARPIAEIALDCGFADQSHMTKTFRAMTGIPPGVYRSGAGRYSGR